MKITINNYEAYLLDYLEGRLQEEDIARLEQFLEAHPELERATREDLFYLPVANQEEFPAKESLYRTATITFMPLRRLAAVASLALLVSFAWWMIQRNAPEKPLAETRQLPGSGTLSEGFREAGNRIAEIAETAEPETGGTANYEQFQPSAPAVFPEAVPGTETRQEELLAFRLEPLRTAVIAQTNPGEEMLVPGLASRRPMDSHYQPSGSGDQLKGLQAVLAYNVGKAILPESVSRDLGLEDKDAKVDDVIVEVDVRSPLIGFLLPNGK